MKTQFFEIADLKSKPMLFWSNQLEHGADGFFGNIYFVACDGRKFRVAFSCMYGLYEAKFFYFRSRQAFLTRYAVSIRELVDKVFEFLND